MNQIFCDNDVFCLHKLVFFVYVLLMVIIFSYSGIPVQFMDFFLLLWQSYIADIGPEIVREGMELSGAPKGIPSLPEYLAEYCSLAVSV